MTMLLDHPHAKTSDEGTEAPDEDFFIELVRTSIDIKLEHCGCSCSCDAHGCGGGCNCGVCG